MQISTLILPLLLFACNTNSEQSENDQFLEVMDSFESGYRNLAIPNLVLSYQDNLRNYSNSISLEKQRKFFQKIHSQLESISYSNLTSDLQFEYSFIEYEVDINLERIDLSQHLNPDQTINENGIYHNDHGKEWYAHFVKSWTSGDLSPEEIVEYGVSEANRIKQEMKKIESTSNKSDFTSFLNADLFVTGDNNEVLNAFNEAKKIVDAQLSLYFPDFTELPEVGIARGTNPQLAQTPGYYNNNTFYYNLFNQPFNLRQVDWLFIHEANPGHHFQINYENQIEVPSYRDGISYSGFREGWAAYVENLGQEVGLYRTPYDYYSKWEWDIIRSVRLILDVGINYQGWTNEKALETWKTYIDSQDDIGVREINRMRRWPAQVLTYKIGAKVIKETKSRVRKELGESFSLKQFHTTLLSQRSIPVKLIPKLFEE